MLVTIFIIAFVSAFLIRMADRTGLRDKVSLKAPKLVYEALQCDFCLCFWVNMGISIIWALTTLELAVALIPFCSTIITLKLIK